MDLASFNNDPTLFQQSQSQIITTAANAAGVPNNKVSVQAIEFKKSDNGSTSTDNLTANGQDLTQVLIISGIALLALAIILVLIFLTLHERQKQAAELAAAEGGVVLDEEGEMLVDLMNQEDSFEPISLGETQEQKLKAQIKDLADNDPEIVAQLIKTWLVQN